MKQISLLLFLTIIVFACGSGESGSNDNNNAVSAQVAEVDAEKLWKVRCVACHGVYGNMGINGAANLQEVDISLAERIDIITNGREGEQGIMTAFGEILSNEEIEALARHTMSFNEKL